MEMRGQQGTLFVASGKGMSMFSPVAKITCFSEIWYGDCLPNLLQQEPKLSFEKLLRGCLIATSLNNSLMLTAREVAERKRTYRDRIIL